MRFRIFVCNCAPVIHDKHKFSKTTSDNMLFKVEKKGGVFFFS